eukprot:3324755-Pleurochrysis_carterae.AAC.1
MAAVAQQQHARQPGIVYTLSRMDAGDAFLSLAVVAARQECSPRRGGLPSKLFGCLSSRSRCSSKLFNTSTAQPDCAAECGGCAACIIGERVDAARAISADIF